MSSASQPTDVQLLQHAGIVFTENFATLMVAATMYGVYIVLAAGAIFAVGRRGMPLSAKLMLAYLITGLICVTLYYTSLAILVFRLMRGALMGNPDDPLEERFDLADESIISFGIICNWFASRNGLMFVLGDAIVVWRSWVIACEVPLLLRVVPIILLCISSGLSLTAGTLYTLANTYLTQFGPENALHLVNTCGIAVSLATNATATALIAYKAYNHRKQMRETIGVRNAQSLGIMTFLVESGVLYCICQIIFCIFTTLNVTVGPIYEFQSQWINIMMFISATYPTTIFLLVAYNRSIADKIASSSNIKLPSIKFIAGSRANRVSDPAYVSSSFDGSSHLSSGELDSPFDSERDGGAVMSVAVNYNQAKISHVLNEKV